ncbi:MAG: HEXXH motif-containing putative peptide modification protein [Polyangiales bacterium]
MSSTPSVTDDPFLLVPRDASDTREVLRVLRKTRLYALRALLRPPRAHVSESARRVLVRLREGLEPLIQSDGERLLAVIGTPDVLPSLLSAASGAHPMDECLDVAVPALLVGLDGAGVRPAAALHYRVLGDPLTTLTHPLGPLRAAGVRALRLDSEGLRVDLGAGWTTLPQLAEGPAPGERHAPLRRGHLCVHDTNPLWSLEEHPSKHGNATDLAGRDVTEWCDALDAALELIEVGLPAHFAELQHTLRRVVPVGFHPERHLSASYTEAPGLIYMTLHPDVLTLAEAIVHETQHGKLNALLWQDVVLLNGRSEWTTSPVRDDLRPLMGVLLAVHAFVPVAALHRGLAEADHPLSRTEPFAARREAVLASNADGLRTLYRLGQWTDTGARLRGALGRMQDACVLAAPVLPTQLA